jgi:hypothetical protein
MEGRRESLRVTVVNIAVMVVFTFALVTYLSVDWSSWKVDLLFGALAGVGVAIAQDLAARESIGIRHCVALGFAAPIALIGIRELVAILPTFTSILIITAIATLAIVCIDYGPTRAQEAG